MESCKCSFRPKVANWKWVAPVLFLILCFTAQYTQAQSLGFEGPTGIFITPTAYVSPSPLKGVGRASGAFHSLAGGPVLGNFSTASVTFGFAQRFEIGYTGVIHSDGNPTHNVGNITNLSPLWKDDYSIAHGKANVIPENFMGLKWVPAVSVGGVFRFNDKEMFNGGSDQPLTSIFEVMENDGYYHRTWNGDGYLVGTKTITQIYAKTPITLSGGVRGTNAALWGLAGNASCFKTRGFGSVAVEMPTLPYGIRVIPAAEYSQQPKNVAYGGYSRVAGGNIPGRGIHNSQGVLDMQGSEAYSLRIIPSPKYKLDLDASVLHIGDNVGSIPAAYNLTGKAVPIRLDAKYRVMFGVSYGF
jgi:hypothetical protein